MSNWYYAVNNDQLGPVEEAELKKMLREHQLTGTTLVWKEGMDAWTPASNVSDLTAPTPPPLTRITPPPVTSSTTSAAKTTSAPLPASLAGMELSEVHKNRALAAISYLSILFIVTLLVAKDEPFARFHAGQGLTLFLFSLVLGVVVTVMEAILVHIPLIGLLTPLLHLLYLVPFILMILGIINALKGRTKPLPFIGGYALVK